MNSQWNQLLRYVRGDASAKLPKEEFCWLIEAANAKMESMERVAHAALSGETTVQLAARVAELEAQLETAHQVRRGDLAVIAALDSYKTEHERVCAGTWVPVGERLPEGRCPIMNGGRFIFEAFHNDGLWINMRPTNESGDMVLRSVTHWLDAKLPTSSGEGE